VHVAEVTIRLVIDRATGKKDVVISYSTDADALPMEHEDEHKRLVDRLIEGGALSAADLGKIVVERVQKSDLGSDRAAEQPTAERTKLDQKG
jgi:hypothetical protein